MDATIYVLEELPLGPEPLIYLAGPIPRDAGQRSWHPDAISAIRALGFGGHVIVPRPRTALASDPLAQIRWEFAAMSRADALLFWIPRVLWTLPGLTTNLEWGIWHDSGKAVLGAPKGTPKMSYLVFHAERSGAPVVDSLTDAARIAIDICLRRLT